MNLTVLKYAVEVEKSSSITAAAKQLFISQPNLSRDIKELEEEIGFSIFSRSSRGVIPTNKGREFLTLAKRVIRQYQALENYCAKRESDTVSLHVCVPRSGYITYAFTNFMNMAGKGKKLSVNYREADTPAAIASVLEHNSTLAILRYPDRYERTLLPLLKLRELTYTPLYKFELAVLMSEKHPLAKTSVLTQDMLENSIELLHDDSSLAAFLHEPPEPEQEGNCIRIHERGSQYDILSSVRGTHMYDSPVPEDVLARHRLVQKKCQGSARKMTDLLIYPEDYRLTQTETLFLELVRQAAP